MTTGETIAQARQDIRISLFGPDGQSGGLLQAGKLAADTALQTRAFYGSVQTAKRQAQAIRAATSGEAALAQAQLLEPVAGQLPQALGAVAGRRFKMRAALSESDVVAAASRAAENMCIVALEHDTPLLRHIASRAGRYATALATLSETYHTDTFLGLDTMAASLPAKSAAVIDQLRQDDDPAVLRISGEYYLMRGTYEALEVRAGEAYLEDVRLTTGLGREALVGADLLERIERLPNA